ncbi:hypothetical protein ABZ915_09910 [Streptomyces sp. NPDC046915]|uniref:hypothetical protein n=1 Tax=Streptomyces sp. NPDC046915 TaxID=3155257 RepID=UPI0033FD0389
MRLVGDGLADWAREVTDVTPWLRFTLRVAPLPLLLAAVVLPYGATASYGAQPTPSGSATGSPAPSRSSSPSAGPSRAGSRAGEGRRRPGRPEAPPAEIEGDDDTPSTQDTEPQGLDPQDEAGEAQVPRDAGTEPPAASESPEQADPVTSAPPPRDPDQTVTQGGEDAAEPFVRILPLGSGLILIGLGLGLAFLGLRVRRG